MTRQQLDALVAFINAAALDAERANDPNMSMRIACGRNAAQKQDDLYQAFGFDPTTEHS